MGPRDSESGRYECVLMVGLVGALWLSPLGLLLLCGVDALKVQTFESFKRQVSERRVTQKHVKTGQVKPDLSDWTGL